MQYTRHMRSNHELDCYFKSKRFLKRLDDIRKLVDKERIAIGTFSIIKQFNLMDYHYGIIRHYILTKKYNPDKADNRPIEVVDYKNFSINGSNDTGRQFFDHIGLLEPQGIHITLPPGTRKQDIIDFVKDNFQTIKKSLNEAYEGNSSHRHAFKAVETIDKQLEIVDKIDEMGGQPSFSLCTELAVEYNVDASDIRKWHKRLGRQNNPFLRPE